MPRYHLEFRVVEMHDFEVVADSKEEAEMMVYDLDLKPNFVDPICYELDDIWECNTKEDHLTPAEYNKLRTENLDWLSGKEK